ncbi:CNNM domain-containing protein [Roseimaritima sediminicola]|uniref:CNNM domain-containing protein n=1 Tax=Roseimaritima sediminicola TaxID=2662066 RepID=UPI001F3EB2D2|nr:CNNM domain-containing protein [Roseimaritima sediminicola]
MSAWPVVLPWLLPMATLIVLSAFFSSSEAALFSLRARDLRTLARRGAAGRAAGRLLEQPERLLSAILFWNLMINMLYFGIASIVGGRLEQAEQGGSAAAIGFTVASLLAIIFCSEMLPKSLAVVSPVRLSFYIAPPLTLAVRAVSPLLPVISVANLFTRRLIWPSFEPEADLDLTDIERAIDLGTGDAALAARERAMLQRLVEMADTRVGEWMCPRSQLRIDTLPVDEDILQRPLPPDGYLLFAEPGTEEVVAAVAVRRLRPSQIDDLANHVESVLYVPWSATVSHALDVMVQQDRHVVAVVNEYGETVGVLTMDDVMRQLLSGPDRHPYHTTRSQIEEVEPGLLRVAGNTSARRLAKLLGLARPEGRSVTVTGWMQRVNERVPRLGDTCRWEHYQLKVCDEHEDGTLSIEIRSIDDVDAEEPLR